MGNFFEDVVLPTQIKACEKIGKPLDRLADMIDKILSLPVEERKKHVGLFVSLYQLLNIGTYRSEKEMQEDAERAKKEYLKQLEEYK